MKPQRIRINRPGRQPEDLELTKPALSILQPAACEARPGESLFESAVRTLLTEALIIEHGNQRHAAELLGVSPRVVGYWVDKLQLMPVRRRPGQKRKRPAPRVCVPEEVPA